jgi:hypothetical protein
VRPDCAIYSSTRTTREKLGKPMQESGFSEYVQNINGMKDFMGLIVGHFQNAKTAGLDTAENIKKIKTDEFNTLCAFIEKTFSEIVVNPQFNHVSIYAQHSKPDNANQQSLLRAQERKFHFFN